MPMALRTRHRIMERFESVQSLNLQTSEEYLHSNNRTIMITIYEEPLRENPDIFTLTGYETKDNLYELLKIVGHPLPKSKSKGSAKRVH